MSDLRRKFAVVFAFFTAFGWNAATAGGGRLDAKNPAQSGDAPRGRIAS